jgi:hypothetical protein
MRCGVETDEIAVRTLTVVAGPLRTPAYSKTPRSVDSRDLRQAEWGSTVIPHVGFGSKADIGLAPLDVCFTHITGRRLDVRFVPKADIVKIVRSRRGSRPAYRQFSAIRTYTSFVLCYFECGVPR